MTEVLHKYRIFFVLLGIIALIALVLVIVSRQDLNKIPTKGVFVQELKVRGHTGQGMGTHLQSPL